MTKVPVAQEDDQTFSFTVYCKYNKRRDKNTAYIWALSALKSYLHLALSALKSYLHLGPECLIVLSTSWALSALKSYLHLSPECLKVLSTSGP